MIAIHRLAAFLLLPASLMVLGCGGEGKSAKLVPVSGKVTLDGAPLTSGTINFTPEDSKGTAAAGQIGSDGTYKLAAGAKEGAAVGKYKVSIGAGMKSMSTDPSAAPKLSEPEKAPVPQKYQNSDASGIVMEVKEGAQPGAYDIKLTSK